MIEHAAVRRVLDLCVDQRAGRIDVEFAQLPGIGERSFVGAQLVERVAVRLVGIAAAARESIGDRLQARVIVCAERQRGQCVPFLGPRLDAGAVSGLQPVFENHGEGQGFGRIDCFGAAHVERGEHQPAFACIGDLVVGRDDAEVGPVHDREQPERRVGEVDLPAVEGFCTVALHPRRDDELLDVGPRFQRKAVDRLIGLPALEPALDDAAGVLRLRSHRRHQSAERPRTGRAIGAPVVHHREIGDHQFFRDHDVGRRVECTVFGDGRPCAGDRKQQTEEKFHPHGQPTPCDLRYS
jgi:hypothetical protein